MTDNRDTPGSGVYLKKTSILPMSTQISSSTILYAHGATILFHILVAIAIIYNSRAEKGPMDQQLSRLSICGYILLVVSVLAIIPFIGKTYAVTSE
jgi:hypothetical protein